MPFGIPIRRRFHLPFTILWSDDTMGIIFSPVELLELSALP
jgi:hypothetical protein